MSSTTMLRTVRTRAPGPGVAHARDVGEVARAVGIDLRRGHDPRQHHVLADHLQQLDDLARRQAGRQRLIGRVGGRHVAHHLVGEAHDEQRVALQRTVLDRADRVDLRVGHPDGAGDRLVLVPLVLGAGRQRGDAQDRQLAQHRVQLQVAQQRAAPAQPRPERGRGVGHQREHVQLRRSPERVGHLGRGVLRAHVGQPAHSGPNRKRRSAPTAWMPSRHVIFLPSS